MVEKYNMSVTITSDNVLKVFAGHIMTSNQSTLCNIRIMNATAQAIIVPDSPLVYDVIVDRDFLEQEHIVNIKRK